MSKKKRNVDFMSVSDAKFNHIKRIYMTYAKQVFDLVNLHGIKYDNLDKKVYDDLASIMYQTYKLTMQSTNDSMNAIADYCNERNVELPFALIYKLQAFLQTMVMVEYMVAVDQRNLLGKDITLEDQCDIYQGTIDQGFASLKKAQEEADWAGIEEHFMRLKNMIDSDADPEEISQAYTADVNKLSFSDLGYIVQKFESLLAIGNTIAMNKSPELIRLESIIRVLVQISRKEIDRRRVSN